MKLKIKYIPYERFEKMDTDKLISEIKKKNIILIDARIGSKEETKLIEDVMRKISGRFKGIEFASIEFEEKNFSLLGMLRKRLKEFVIGYKRGITVIGPANLIREIKRNPEELLLYVR